MATPARRRRSIARLLGLVVVALAAAACQAHTTVDLAVQPDGSGTVTVSVTLDAEAAAHIPDLGSQLRSADLTKAGWTIVGPSPVAGGGTVVSARKSFGRAADAGRVLSELTGPTGPFRNFQVSRRRGFASTSYGVTGTVDLSGGLAAFGDPDLTRLLDGKPFGRTPDELKLLLAGHPLADVAPFTLQVHLPRGGGRTYQLHLGDAPVTVGASRTVSQTTPWLLVGGALLAVVVAVFAFVDARRRPNRRLRRPSERGTGSYVRRPYQTIDEVDEGPVPGVGGPPSAERVRPVPAGRPAPAVGPTSTPPRSGPPGSPRRPPSEADRSSSGRTPGSPPRPGRPADPRPAPGSAAPGRPTPPRRPPGPARQGGRPPAPPAGPRRRPGPPGDAGDPNA